MLIFSTAWINKGKKTLLVTGDYERNIYLSGRNLSKSEVRVASDLNTYDILNANTLILAESAIEKITAIL